MKYDSVLEYLEKFRESDPPYDTVGAFTLLEALLTNMRQNTITGDLKEYSGCLSPENEIFMQRIIDHIPNSRKEM